MEKKVKKFLKRMTELHNGKDGIKDKLVSFEILKNKKKKSDSGGEDYMELTILFCVENRFKTKDWGIIKVPKSNLKRKEPNVCEYQYRHKKQEVI